MQKLVYKVGVGITTTALLATSMVGMVGAMNKCEIKNNGNRSRNRCRVRVSKNVRKVQRNSSRNTNIVRVGVSTGGNNVSRNTGKGNFRAISGDATITITITNEGNLNDMNSEPEMPGPGPAL
jgi:hypothetical protein